MMKGMLKKALGVVAAAALAVTGFAATANAAEPTDPVDTGVTFTFTASTEQQLENRDVDACRIGEFVDYGNGVYGIRTAAGVDRATLYAALDAAGFDNIPTDGTTDLLAWAASQEAPSTVFNSNEGVAEGTVSRLFADYLAKYLPMNAPTDEDILDGQAVTGEESPYSVSVTLPAGLYLFVDNATSVGAATPSAPILISSGTFTDGKLTSVTENRTINFKNKESDLGKTSQHVKGDRIEFTITGTHDADYADSLTFYDRPGTGLSIDPTTLKVYAVGQGEGDADLELSLTKDYTVEWSGMTVTDQFDPTPEDADNGDAYTVYKGNGVDQFTVSIADAALEDVVTYKVVYEAIVNSDAMDQDNVCNVLVDENGTTVDRTDDTLYSFDFTKVDAKGNALAGATFTIAGENGEAFSSYYTGGSNGDDTSTSTAEGKVEFTKLPAGTYTVTETGVPDGFQNLNLSFKVTVGENGVQISDVKSTVNTNIFADVVKKNEATDKYEVTNVHSVTELPMTGAAGITMFVVLGLLIAGAGVTVYMKSRGVRNAMHA